MAAIVMRLCEAGCIFNTYKIIVGDSAFGSFELSVALLNAGLYSAFCLKAKRFWPKHTNGAEYIKEIMKLPFGSVLARIGCSTLTTSYRFVMFGMNIIVFKSPLSLS